LRRQAISDRELEEMLEALAKCEWNLEQVVNDVSLSTRRWWQLKDDFIFTPKIGDDDPI